MAGSPLRHQLSPVELQAQLQAEKQAEPFLTYRDGGGRQQIVTLGEASRRLTIGRGPTTDIWLDWDSQVSRTHAALEWMGDGWTITDDGLSRNGTFVNGDRVAGRRRLRDRDGVRIGQTVLFYRMPRAPEAATTDLAREDQNRTPLTAAQRRVLVALSGPFKDSSGFATPATNQQIADDLCLSVAAVKTHLRALFRAFGIEDLPQNRKRARLVELGFELGEIHESDL